jgi:hypothetical protein
LEPNLDSEIKEEQKSCSLYAFSLALGMPARMESSDPPDQSVIIAHFGEWELTEEVNFEGRLAYRATLRDHNDKKRSLQLVCWPSDSDRGFEFLLFDETIKSSKIQSLLVTFNNSRLATLDQLEAKGSEGRVNVKPLILELVGCSRCNPPTAPHEGPLLLAIQDRKLEFRPSEARAVWDELARRCHL